MEGCPGWFQNQPKSIPKTVGTKEPYQESPLYCPFPLASFVPIKGVLQKLVKSFHTSRTPAALLEQLARCAVHTHWLCQVYVLCLKHQRTAVPAHQPSLAQLRPFRPSKQFQFDNSPWLFHLSPILNMPASKTLQNYPEYLRGFDSLPNWDVNYFLFLLSTVKVILIHLEFRYKDRNW